MENKTLNFDMNKVIDRVITEQVDKDQRVMINEISHKITKFMNWEEFEFIDDWNGLHPVIAKISSMWEDQAELMYDYYFVNIYNSLSAVDMLPHIDKCIDELMKREKSVYGSVYEITISNIARFKDLAMAIDEQQVHHCEIGDYVWIDQNGFICSFMKSSDEFKQEFIGDYVAEVGRDVVVGDTFEEIIAAVLSEMDDYTPSTVVNVNSVN